MPIPSKDELFEKDPENSMLKSDVDFRDLDDQVIIEKDEEDQAEIV